MKIARITTLRLLPLIAGAALSLATEAADEQVKQEPPRAETSAPVRYMPPAGEQPTPETRVAKGGSRGGEEMSTAVLTLLLPEHVALTSSAHPTLYWFQRTVASLHTQVIVTGIDEPKPAVEINLSEIAPGIHGVDLAAHGVTLNENVTYQWTIRVAANTGNVSTSDPLASGFIKRVAGKGEQDEAAATDAVKAAQALAAKGLWCDALQALYASTSPAVVAARVSLLKQIDLTDDAILNAPLVAVH